MAGRSPTSNASTDRRRTLALQLGALGLVALVTAMLFGVRSVRADLLEARSHLLTARDHLDEAEVDDALSRLRVAEVLLGRARATLRRPDLRAATLVPLVGRDVRIVRALTVGADDVVTAAGDALVRARVLVEGDLTEGLPVQELRELAGPLAGTATAAERALELVRDAPERALTRQVGEARRDFLELLEPVARQVRVGAEVTRALPTFLGSDGPRRHLLAAANPAELRGVGGYLGSYTILTIEDGSLSFGEFLPLEDLPALPASAVPDDLLAPRYERFRATELFKNANMTPDMPSASRVLAAQWAALTGQRIDGVILVDPFALEAMLRVTGPVTISDGTRLSPDNAVRYLVNEAYADYVDDQSSRKSELGEAAELILERFLGNAGEAVDHLGDLGALVAERHLLLWSAAPDEQSAFAAAGLDGALPDPEGDFLTVVANSATNAKVDYWLEQDLTYRVHLLADGAARGELAVRLDNDAPRGGFPRYVLGPSVEGVEAGDNRLWLSTYCSTRCTFLGGEGGLGRALLEEELDHPVAGTWVEIPAGGEQTLDYSWRTEDAWSVEGDELVYRLFVRPQALVRPVELMVEVVVPPGFRPAGDPGEDVVVVEGGDGPLLRWEGFATADRQLRFRMRNAG